MATVTLKPSGKKIEIATDKSLLEALTEQGIYIKSSCGGHASCSDCIIKVVSGADNLNEPTFDETQYLGNVFHITKERLSCQTRLNGDICIDISSHDEETDREKIRTKKHNPNKNIIKRKKDEIIVNTETKENDPIPPKEGGYKKPKLFNSIEENPDDMVPWELKDQYTRKFSSGNNRPDDIGNRVRNDKGNDHLNEDDDNFGNRDPEEYQKLTGRTNENYPRNPNHKKRFNNGPYDGQGSAGGPRKRPHNKFRKNFKKKPTGE